jgi:hypothetical protein
MASRVTDERPDRMKTGRISIIALARSLSTSETSASRRRNGFHLPPCICRRALFGLAIDDKQSHVRSSDILHEHYPITGYWGNHDLYILT